MKLNLLLGLASVVLLVHGSVYDDCVFRFTGGKDVNGDGIIRQGTSVNQELFNEMKAGVPTDATQYCEVRGDSTGVVFRTEKVVIPCRPCETQDMQVLYFPQRVYRTDNADGSVTTNFAPSSINMSFLAKLITNASYSAVYRIRRDPGYTPGRTVDFAALGYNYPYGCILRIDGNDTNETRGVNIYTSKTPTWSVGKSCFYFPTNMWVDIAVSVTNWKIRVALARPDRPVVMSTVTTATELSTATNSASKKGNWRFSNQANPSNALIDYNQTESSARTYYYTTFPFHGSLQQMAYWNRTLSDDEILEALGAPRPNLLQVGLANDASEEFGASRTSSSQSLDAASPTWRNYTSTMVAGDEWTASFAVLAEESDLAQIFTVRTTTSSPACQLLLKVNGNSLGGRVVQPGRDQRWFVPASAIQTGSNQLTLKRVDSGETAVAVDVFRLGGSWQAGRKNSSNAELSGEQKTATSFRSSADMGWKHWISPLCTYPGGLGGGFVASNQVIHVWADEGVADLCPSSFSFSSCRYDRSMALKGTEGFDVAVNGVDCLHVAATEANAGSWTAHAVSLPAGFLHAGWNEIRFKATPTQTNYWLIDYYRFALSCWARGTFLFLR